MTFSGGKRRKKKEKKLEEIKQIPNRIVEGRPLLVEKRKGKSGDRFRSQWVYFLCFCYAFFDFDFLFFVSYKRFFFTFGKPHLCMGHRLCTEILFDGMNGAAVLNFFRVGENLRI